jgi:hypothetical protein
LYQAQRALNGSDEIGNDVSHCNRSLEVLGGPELQWVPLTVHNEAAGFELLLQQRVGALLVTGDA